MGRLFGGKDVSSLIYRIHETTFDEALWPSAMAALSAAVGASASSLFSPGELRGNRSIGCLYQTDPDMWVEYTRRYHRADLWLAAAKANNALNPGNIITYESMTPERTLTRSVFYREFLRRYDIRYMMSACLTDEQDASLGPRTHLGFHRAPSAAPFAQESSKLLSLLLPHLRAALLAHWRLRSNGLWGGWSESLLSSLERPVFVVSRGGTLLYANTPAMTLFGPRRELRLSHQRVQINNSSRSGILENIVARTYVPTTLQIGRWTLRIIPLQNARSTRSIFRWFPRAAYLVLPELKLPVAASPAIELAARFGLTQAETRVLNQLQCGFGPARIASELGVGISTVRTHLAHLYSKTHTRTQRELIALLMAKSAPG